MKRRSLPADLPARAAEEAVRRLALAELERAVAAREALVAGDRDEALHDLRVALRRLRSLLRSHRGEFSLDYPKKLLKRFAALAAATNPGRDAEVQIAWLESIDAGLKPTERAGHEELVRQLADRRDECYRKVEREIVRDFGALADSLRERLSSYRVEVRLDRASKASGFATATRAALTRAVEELTSRLDRIVSADDEAEGHAARIAAKRLRYLIEPLVPWSDEAKAPVDRLKELQDLLGELHDGQLLASQVASALAEIESRRALALVEATLGRGAPAGAPGPEGDAKDGSARPSTPPTRRRERSGLLAVARALGERRMELFTELAAGWLGAEPKERVALAEELAVLDARLVQPPSSWRTSARARRRHNRA